MVFGIREIVVDMNNFKPEKIFLFIILIFGFLNLLITPIGAGFDEDTHVHVPQTHILEDPEVNGIILRTAAVIPRTVYIIPAQFALIDDG